MELKITDDSGFIAIVDGHQYHSFVDEDWSFPDLMSHFAGEMNKENLIIWATGAENVWTGFFFGVSIRKTVVQGIQQNNQCNKGTIIINKL
jgi:hypothetical protein